MKLNFSFIQEIVQKNRKNNSISRKKILCPFLVTEASKDNNNGFRSSAADTHPVNSLTKSPSSILDSKDLNEKLLLENFGPGTFASAEEIAADEENDAKLWFDLIQSMEIWQNNKLIRAKRKRYSKKFVKFFHHFCQN